MAVIYLDLDTPSPRAGSYSVDLTLDTWPEGVGDLYAFSLVDVISADGEVLAFVRAEFNHIDIGSDPFEKYITFHGAYYAGGDLDGSAIFDEDDIDIAPRMPYDYQCGQGGEPIHTYRLIIEKSPKQDWTGDETSSGDDQLGTAFRFSVYDLNGGRTVFVRDLFVEDVYAGDCLVNPMCGMDSPYELQYISPVWSNFRWNDEPLTRLSPGYDGASGAALYKWYTNDGSFSDQSMVLHTPWETQTWTEDDDDHRVLFSSKENGLVGSYYLTAGVDLVEVDPDEDPVAFYTSIQAKTWSGRASISTNVIIASDSVNSLDVDMELYRNDEVIASDSFTLSASDFHISTLSVPNIPVYGGDLYWVRVSATGDWGVGHLYTVNNSGYYLSFVPTLRDSEFGSIAGFRGIETATGQIRTVDENAVMIDYYRYKYDTPRKVRADKVLELSGNSVVEYHGPIVTTRNNTGYQFGGMTSLKVPSDAIPTLGSQFSAELWFKVDPYYRAADMKMLSFDGDYGFWIKTGTETSGELIVGFQGFDTNSITHDDVYIFDNAWHHVALTYDSTTLRMYLDGEVVETLTTGNTIVFGDPSMIVGKNFTGSLDDVAVYDYALNQSQINSRYLVPRIR